MASPLSDASYACLALFVTPILCDLQEDADVVLYRPRVYQEVDVLRHEDIGPEGHVAPGACDIKGVSQPEAERLAAQKRLALEAGEGQNGLAPIPWTHS